MKRIGAALGVIFLVGAIGAGWLSSVARAAGPDKRIALVIGNGAYRRAPLSHAASDAKLMADTLRKLNFTVLDHYDANQKDMKRAIGAYGDAVAAEGKDAVAFIYYAGHGVQVKSENYLIPVGENIRSERDVDIDAIKVGSLMSMLENVETRLNIVVLDACRNNPFQSSRSLGQGGLAQVAAPNGAMGSLVAFSTAPNRVAMDDSPYAATLAQALSEPGLSLDKAFMKVRAAVKVATRDEQVPWEQTSLTGDFYPAGNAEAASVGSELARLETENKRREAEIARLEEENRRIAEQDAAAAAPDAPAEETADDWQGYGAAGSVSSSGVAVVAYCAEGGTMGLQRGKDRRTVESQAIRACVDDGRSSRECCIRNLRSTGNGCLGVAVGPKGQWALAQSTDRDGALRRAAQRCGAGCGEKGQVAVCVQNDGR